MLFSFPKLFWTLLLTCLVPPTLIVSQSEVEEIKRYEDHPTQQLQYSYRVQAETINKLVALVETLRDKISTLEKGAELTNQKLESQNQRIEGFVADVSGRTASLERYRDSRLTPASDVEEREGNLGILQKGYENALDRMTQFLTSVNVHINETFGHLEQVTRSEDENVKLTHKQRVQKFNVTDEPRVEKIKLTVEQRVEKILQASPVIDGHNDLPYNMRRLAFNDLRRVNFSEDLNQNPIWGNDTSSHTDIPRLRKGHVGAQFWVAYTSCASQFKDSVEQTLEQIDLIRRLVKKYPGDLQFATSADEIESAIKNGKIASLVAVEGGHSMQFSFGILRSLYDLGTRYMTLTHSCNTPWGDASPVDAKNSTLLGESDGLSEFGLKIVREMNRLGMMVDLSHVSKRTMEKALNHSLAPVIFSHSSSRAVCDHHRNVPDSVLDTVKATNSLVMVTFYTGFVRCDGQNATLEDVLEHIEHIRNRTGPDHVGIGGDYDGVDSTPQGLEDVSKYPDLIRALVETGRWSDEDLEKLTGKNLLRVFRDVEKVRDALQEIEPDQDAMKVEELEAHLVDRGCITATFERLTPEERRVGNELPEDTETQEL